MVITKDDKRCSEYPIPLDTSVIPDIFFADFSGSDVFTERTANSLEYKSIVAQISTERLREIVKTHRIYILNAYSLYFEIRLYGACMDVITAELATRRKEWK